ncbi:MAG: class I SAM-dependent methyltransferase [Candidatus Gracilibacteria bacterium]|nr:class I SAM-dependent methyltransferase [Candidatus Gracilibacteria bacterium]
MNINVIEIVILIILIPFALAGMSLAPWVPTRKKDYIRGLKLVEFKKGDNFYEIGSGDGRVTFYAGKNHDINARGIEICYPIYLYAKIKNIIQKNRNISFENADLFKYDFSDADVIYLYGMPDKNPKLIDKFRKELKKGTKIISYTFEIKGLEPIEISKPTENDLPIYLYEF